MTKWFNQAVINYTYSDYEGYSDRKELAALRLLLKRAESFDEAVFTYNAAENSVCDCYDVLKGALGIAAKRAKGYDDNIFVMARSEFGTEQYIKAMKKPRNLQVANWN